jgi:hypothetical protein
VRDPPAVGPRACVARLAIATKICSRAPPLIIAGLAREGAGPRFVA